MPQWFLNLVRPIVGWFSSIFWRLEHKGVENIPTDTGLIVADAFGAQIVCEAPEHRLHAATRKSMTLNIARAAALRLQSLVDPAGPYAGEI